MIRITVSVFLLMLTFNSSIIQAKAKFPPKPIANEVSRKLEVMIEVVDQILARGHADHDNLCGPDELIRSEFVYSSECCARNDSGECTGTRQTRMKKGLCVRRDESGAIYDSYDSYGETEYGECVEVTSGDELETVTPF